MKKQPEITEKTKQAFADAFCEIYSRKPIEKISVQEIANKSGYNRSTFYQHFCDIYELLEYLENDVLDFMHQKLHNGTGDIQDVFALYEEKGVYLNALLGDYGSNRFLERLKASIPFDAHKLSLTADHPLTPYLMEFHLTTILSMLRLWQRRQKDLTPKELVNLMLSLYVGGVSAILSKHNQTA